MDLVVDANVLFSILIKSGKTEELMLETDLHLFCPEFIFDEFEKYKDEILEKTKRTKKEYDDVFDVIKVKIKTIPNEETEKYMDEARRICPDKKDVDYFALALKMKCAVWSNDKPIKNKQNEVRIYNTEELVKMFE